MARHVTIRVPATSANLGPGFDCLALALDLWNTTTFTEQGSKIEVEIGGEGNGTLPRDASNLILRAFLEIYRRCGGSPPTGLLVQCNNQIPFSSGLGSSAAAVLTGIAGGNAFLGMPFSRGEMLQIAAELEGHADNAAAAVYGGLTLVTHSADGKILTRVLECQPWSVVIVLPELQLSTADARRVLPEHVTVKDAVFNIGHSLLTAEALRTGDFEMLAAGFTDRLHQPYRLKLIPGAAEALEAAQKIGVPAALSGAGPSVIAFSKNDPASIQAAMQAAFLNAGLKSRGWILHTTRYGMQVV